MSSFFPPLSLFLSLLVVLCVYSRWFEFCGQRDLGTAAAAALLVRPLAEALGAGHFVCCRV